MYNIHEYPKYLRIGATWYCAIQEALDEYTNKVENEFVKTYSNTLHFLRSFISVSPISFCKQRGVRLDRVF